MKFCHGFLHHESQIYQSYCRYLFPHLLCMVHQTTSDHYRKPTGKGPNKKTLFSWNLNMSWFLNCLVHHESQINQSYCRFCSLTSLILRFFLTRMLRMSISSQNCSLFAGQHMVGTCRPYLLKKKKEYNNSICSD